MQKWEELAYAKLDGKEEIILDLITDGTITPEQGATKLNISLAELEILATEKREVIHPL